MIKICIEGDHDANLTKLRVDGAKDEHDAMVVPTLLGQAQIDYLVKETPWDTQNAIAAIFVSMAIQLKALGFTEDQVCNMAKVNINELKALYEQACQGIKH